MKLKKLFKKLKIQNINTVEYWNAIWEKSRLEGRNNPLLHNKIINLVTPESKIVDLGCGNGLLLRKIKEQKHCECTGVDFSDVIIDRLKPYEINAVVANLPKTNFKNNSFDAVLCCETLEHLSNPSKTIKEMYRIAKTDAIILFTIPDGCLWGEGKEHINVFKPTDCVNLLRRYVKEVHLIATVTDEGYPYLLCYGHKAETAPKYFFQK